MSTQDEHVAKLQIQFEVLVGQANQVLAEITDQVTTQDAKWNKLSRTLDNAGQMFNDLTGKGTAAAGAVEKQAAAWDGYAQKLKDANAAYQAFRKDQVAGTSTSGAASLGDLSASQKQQLLDIDAAQKASVTAAISEEQRGAEQKQAIREGEDRIYNQLLSEQTAAHKRAVDLAIADAERQTQAFVSEYTKQYQAAVKIDDQIAAEQQSKRYATPNLASRNTASASGYSAAQQEYSAQELASMNEYYAALEKQTAAAKGLSESALPRLRYALYDVSTTMTIAGIAMTGFGLLALKAATDYQAGFANVERTTQTTGAAAGVLYDQLVQLTQTMPESFKGVTEIASLGGQLGIASNQIANFTKNVIEFSTTANVSIDTTATAFGRLSALLPGVDGNFEALGSSMLKVGINSVATDQQIITIAGRLAGIGSTAGLTAGQIIGISGALASVGVQAYQSQGTITRIFTKIIEAVNDGGKALNQFGATAGMSGEQFQTAWKTDAAGTFVKLLDGINSAGPGAVQAIQDLGIKSAGDIPTLLKLAQNTDIVTQSIKDGTSGYAEHTQMAESYAIKSQTVSAKLEILKNNFTSLNAAVGSAATGLGGLLDLTNNFLVWLTNVTKSPIGSTLATIAVGLALVGGAALLGTGAFLRLAASAAAVTTATAGQAGAAGLLSEAWSLVTGATLRATAAQTGLAAAEGATTAATEAQAAATTEAASASGVLATSMKGLGVVGLVLIGMQLGGMFADWANQASGFTTTIDSAAKALDNFDKKKIISDLGLNKPTVANTKGAAAGDVLQGTYSSLAGRASIGGGAIATGQDFANSMGLAGLGLGDIAKTIKNYDQSLAALVQGGNGKKAADEFALITSKAVQQGATLSDIKKQFPLYAAALDGAGKSAKTSADGIDAQTQALADNVAASTDGVTAAIKMQDAMYKLGGTLAASSSDFSEYSVNGRANLQALQAVMAQYVTEAGGDSQVLADNLQGLFNALTQGAKVPAASLEFLSRTIANLGVKSITPTTTDLSSLNQGFADTQVKAEKAAASTQKAAEQIHTLVDYANDLGGVFSRAFDIRYGGGEALDTIAKGWDAIRQKASDAQVAIAKANASLMQLASDKSIDEYWLKVANMYGDTLRAAQIQTDLAKNAQDTTAAQQDLATAQDATNKTLVGNSQAAQDNRATILGLVGNYEAYIQKLAASGADQATLQAASARLKQEFIQQATQLGFNSNELQTYAASFDDVAKAIARVPRNITVTANADPALQALNEFLAKAKSTVGSGINVPITTTGGADVAAQQAKQARGAVLQAQISQLQNQLNNNNFTPAAFAAKLQYMQQLSDKLSSGNYWTGGYTGDGGMYDYAGAVHKGEFVFSAAATSNIGPGNLAFAHEMAKAGKSFSFGGGGGDTSGIVQLSPVDRQLLNTIADRVGLTVSGPALAGVVGAGAINGSNRGVA